MSVERTADLRRWIESATGAEVQRLERRPGGGSHQAYAVELSDGRSTRSCFLRFDQARPKPWNPYSLQREAEVYRALAGTDVPVAAVLAVAAEMQAVLLAAMPGAAAFATIADPLVQQRLMDELCEKLVALHALDARALAIPSFGPVGTIGDHLVEELDIWEAMYRNDADPDPLLTAAFLWLRANPPEVGGPPSLLQGDTGPGNFMHQDGRITALVDWEYAHLGDPVEDIAWVSTRSAQEPPPDLPAFVAEYERRSGRRVPAARLRYYQVLVELRIGVLYARRSAGKPSGGEVGNGLAFAHLHRKLLAETLARVVGGDVAALDEPEPEPPEDDWLFAETLEQLRDVVLPAVADPFARLRTKGVARLVKYFRGLARYRGELRARVLADMEGLLGKRCGDFAEAKAEVERRLVAGELDVARAAPALLREVQREVRMLADVMGVLATRSFAVPGVG
jgi:aminoglycoside phosphotransferase (APT) family kinase protein